VTRILFEVGRLIGRRDRDDPTGVDRVCLAYDRRLRALPGVTVVPVHTTLRRMTALDPRWVEAEITDLAARWAGGPDAGPSPDEVRLMRALTGPRPARSLIGPTDAEPEGRRRRKVERLLRTRPLPELRRGDLYVDVGHAPLDGPWGLARLAEQGVRSQVMIHDLIPISHPEFCRPGEAARHRSRVRAALSHASGVTANSRATAAALAAMAAREGLTGPPVTAAPLGLEPLFHGPRWAPAPTPWFVCVGTLEPRKNLVFLLTVWRRLAESLGAAAPRLALIGRHGWENEAILDHLERSPPLQRQMSLGAAIGATATLSPRAAATGPPSVLSKAGSTKGFGSGALKPPGVGDGRAKTPGEAVHEARLAGAALTGVNTRMEQLAAAMEVRLQAHEAQLMRLHSDLHLMRQQRRSCAFHLDASL
jgi:hypothetical protein